MMCIKLFKWPSIRARISLCLVAVLASGCNTLHPTAEPRPAVEQPAVAPHSALVRPAFPKNENEPEGLSAELLYDLLLSSIAFQEGAVDVATSALIRAAQSTQDPELIARAVRMAIHNKSYDQAVALGGQWVKISGENPRAYIITSLAAILNKQDTTALDILESLFKQDETKHGLYFQQIGDIFLQLTESDAPLSVLTQLVDQHPQLSQGWMVLAGLAQRNENLAEIATLKLPVFIDALDQILALEPNNQTAAGYQLIALGEDAHAQEAFAEQFIKKNPDALIFRMQYARMLLREDREAPALDALLTLLDQDESNGEALYLTALIYQNKEAYQEAAVYFKRRLDAVPNDDRSRIYYASALQQLEKFDAARKALEQVKNKDDVFDSKRQIALLIEQQEGIENALIYLDTLQGIDDSENIQLIIDQELMLKRAGRNSEALAFINESLEQYPQDDSLLYHRALISVEQEDLVSHEADMRVLLERKPENPHYYNTLGYSLLTLSDRLEEAGTLIEKAHELEPKDPYILDSKGWLEYKKGNLAIALNYLNQAFDLDRDAEIAAHIGEVYWVQGEQKKARDVWREGDKIEEDNKSLLETKARFLE